MEISLEDSNKGKKKLIIDGYSYHLERQNEEKYSWVCSKKKKFFCKSRVHTECKVSDCHTILRNPSAHNHDPDAYQKEISKISSKIKNDARCIAEKPSQIITNNVVQCQPDCRSYLPNTKALKQTISRVRCKNLREPKTLSDISFPDSLKFCEGELFVLSEKRINDDLIIVLGTKSSIKLLSEAQCWIMDGTFDVVPSIMRQLYTIHGKIETEIIPLIFCLMTRKTKVLYTEFFKELQQLSVKMNIKLDPQQIITDFEKCVPLAAKTVFTNCVFKGCLFHFGQIIWRKVQREGLQSKYGNNENFSIQVKMIKSLAFVPEDEVSDYFQALKNSFDDPDARKIGNWFNKVYITGEVKTNKSQVTLPQYNPSFWNVVDTFSTNLPRTQNNVEAWHRRLNSIVNKRHIGVYSLVGHLSSELIMGRHKLEQSKSCRNSKQRSRTVIRSKALTSIFKKRQRISKVEYLKSIARNLYLS